MHPKYYCPTRWEGCHRASIGNWNGRGPLQRYPAELKSQGFLPDRRKMNIVAVSEDAEDDDREDDEDWDVWDGNGDSSTRVHNDSFHKFNNKPWDPVHGIWASIVCTSRILRIQMMTTWTQTKKTLNTQKTCRT